MKIVKRWIAVLAILAMVLISLPSGIISASPGGDSEAVVQEQEASAGEDAGVETRDEEEPGDEEADEGDEASEEEVGEEAAPSDEKASETGKKYEGEPSSDEVVTPELIELEPGAEQQCEPWEVTSLNISKDVDIVTPPGWQATLEKKASETEISMEPGDTHDVTFTIDVEATGSFSYYMEGNIFVQNTGEWPADVIAVSDTVWYKAGGPDWQPATSNITTTVPIGYHVIPTGGPHVYSYSGTFTLPVPAEDVTSMSNLIEITISNKPDPPPPGMQDWTYHYRQDFDLPQNGGPGTISLEDIETLTKLGGSDDMGVSYEVKSVEINGVSAPVSPLSWELDLSEGPYCIVIEKELTATSTGECLHEYVLNNKALMDGQEDEAEVKITVEEPCGSICGWKFLDENCNGRWDGGEPGKKGVTIRLTNLDTGKMWETETNCLGCYCFDDLVPGRYLVEEVVPPGYYPTTPNPVEVSLEWPCGMKKTVNFGNAPGGSICGWKFLDENCNGRWDQGEPGLEGVKIILTHLGTGKMWETTTDGSGHYCFTGLNPGRYKVEEIVPEGHYPTTDNPVCVLLCCGGEKKVNFGNAPYGSICGWKFLDENCNGRWDQGEPGLEGVKIILTHLGTGKTWETTTDGSGHYCFTGLNPGRYKVEEVVPEGHYPTTDNPVWLRLCCGEEEKVSFGNAPYGRITGWKFLDENCNGRWDQGEPGLKGVKIILTRVRTGETWCTRTDRKGRFEFTGLKPGRYKVEEVVPKGYYPTTDNPVWLRLCCGEEEKVSFGNARYGKICGFKFLDKNCNGKWDCPLVEWPMKGVTIKLTNLDTEETWETTTNCLGFYCFTGLEPGRYQVEEVVPEGFYPTTPNPVELCLGCASCRMVNFGNANYGKICGSKWEDLDCDGEHDDGEPPVPGIEIQLFLYNEGSGEYEYLESEYTDEFGAYCFGGLLPGTYKVMEFLTPELLEQWYPVNPADGTYEGIELGCAENLDGYDFINARYGSISGTKWNDVNENGTDDPGEEGMEGVTITLEGTTICGNTVSLTTTTSSDGSYSFTNLEPGDYTVSETVPGGMKATSPASKDEELDPGENAVVDFHNAAIVAGEVVTPEVTPEVEGGELPYTGFNQTLMLLAAAVLMSMGMIALALGIIWNRSA